MNNDKSMSAAGHTPGPWYTMTKPDDPRDAHIIAAGPELLAALEAFVECSEAVSTGMYPELFDVARAAIASARGQS